MSGNRLHGVTTSGERQGELDEGAGPSAPPDLSTGGDGSSAITNSSRSLIGLLGSSPDSIREIVAWFTPSLSARAAWLSPFRSRKALIADASNMRMLCAQHNLLSMPIAYRFLQYA